VTTLVLIVLVAEITLAATSTTLTPTTMMMAMIVVVVMVVVVLKVVAAMKVGGMEAVAEKITIMREGGKAIKAVGCSGLIKGVKREAKGSHGRSPLIGPLRLYG